MNAVKRCLALFAAILVASACSGDPTAEDAGTGLTIRTTPAVIWMLENEPTQIDLEAIDALGGTQPGSWTATPAGPFTVALDPDYQPTSSGQLGAIRRFVVTPNAAGEGTITFTGTGGSKTVTVRVAPDPEAFDVVISNLTPAVADQITIAAPAGVRFSATTTVSFVRSGANTVNNGLADPSIVSMNADSSEITLLPAPNAAGRLLITDVANVSTPTLRLEAISVDSVTVGRIDNVAATFSVNPAPENGEVTITMPAGTKLRPTSQVRTVGAPNATDAEVLAAFVVSRSADSNSITVVPMPGFDTLMLISDLVDSRVPTLALPLPTTLKLKTSAQVTAPQSLPNLGDDDATAGPVGVVTVTLAVGQYQIIHDLGTWEGSDWVGFGGPQHDLEVSLTNAGNYTVEFDWDGGEDSDIDVVLFNSTLSGVIGGFAGATGAHPEIITANFPAGSFFITAGIFDGPAPTTIRYRIVRNS